MGRRDARASRRDRAAEFARRHSRGVPPPSPGRFTPRSPAREIMPGAVRIVVGAFRSRCASRNSSRAARSSRAAAGNDTRPIVKCFDGSGRRRVDVPGRPVHTSTRGVRGRTMSASATRAVARRCAAAAASAPLASGSHLRSRHRLLVPTIVASSADRSVASCTPSTAPWTASAGAWRGWSATPYTLDDDEPVLSSPRTPAPPLGPPASARPRRVTAPDPITRPRGPERTPAPGRIPRPPRSRVLPARCTTRTSPRRCAT